MCHPESDGRPPFPMDADLTLYWPWVRPCWEEGPAPTLPKRLICEECGVALSGYALSGRNHECGHVGMLLREDRDDA